MRQILPYIITGLATGSLYGLAALGLVLTYRTSGVFNFGHGAIAAAAAFVFYTLHYTHGLAWPIAAAVTILLFGIVIGFAMERITRGLGDVPQAVVIVATVGVLLATQGLLYEIYGPVIRGFPEFLPTSGFTVVGVNVSWSRVISFTVATGSSLGLYAFLRRSRLGIAMRAVVDNPQLVALAGEDPPRVRAAAWAIGSAFAALSGILLAPALGLDVTLLTLLVVQAFGACAVGWFVSLPLTYVGGLVIGVAASLATKYFTEAPFSGVPSSVPFLVLIVVLLAVPTSRFPQRRATVRSLVAETPPFTGPLRIGLAVLGGIALLLVPNMVGSKLPVWISGLTYVVIFGSLALLVWTSGQISLCHAAFAAVGATTMAHLTQAGVPWLVALLLAACCTVPVGALVAIPALRLSGIYLGLITMGFGILIQNVVFTTWLMFGTKQLLSAPRPQLGMIDGADDRWLYYVVLAIAACTCGALTGIYRSRLGRLLRALAETPTMLTTHGLSVNQTRLIVFCVSAFFAGLGGGLLITQYGSVGGTSFGPIQSLLMLAVLGICGTRLLRSTLLAAVLFAVLPGYVNGFGIDRQTLAFGVTAIAAAIVVAQRTALDAWLARVASNYRGRLAHSPVLERRRATDPVGVASPGPALREFVRTGTVTS